MPLLSYAQNGEDVVLLRALKDVEEGHYIDIGANDPVDDSVTKIFYDRGWSGINVEASKASFERLVAERTRDRNLYVAVSARAGVARFHDVSERGLSTLDPQAAADAGRRGFSIAMVDVPVLSLADICRDLPFEATHFLKIDVEGAERDVLVGADFTAFRPWIIVVEATRPNSPDRVDAAWRDLLEGADYDCALFDGLNLYFLAREHAELRQHLAAPANILDDYLPARLLKISNAERDAIAAERACAETALETERVLARSLQEERESLDADVRRLTEELLEARVTLRVVKESLERELAGLRREKRLDTERYTAELTDAREQLTRLAHFKAQGKRLRQISDLTGAGAHLENRGADLLELRTRLLEQANAWQAEVEHLQGRLAEAAAQSDSLRASTSWRLTSPLRGLQRATHVLRREPHHLPRLMRERVGRLMGHAEVLDSPGGLAAADPVAPQSFETGTRALVTVAARLDREMALIADLLGSVSGVLDEEVPGTAGPFYVEARLEEQLTRWVLGEVARQRRAAL